MIADWWTVHGGALGTFGLDISVVLLLIQTVSIIGIAVLLCFALYRRVFPSPWKLFVKSVTVLLALIGVHTFFMAQTLMVNLTGGSYNPMAGAGLGHSIVEVAITITALVCLGILGYTLAKVYQYGKSTEGVSKLEYDQCSKIKEYKFQEKRSHQRQPKQSAH